MPRIGQELGFLVLGLAYVARYFVLLHMVHDQLNRLRPVAKRDPDGFVEVDVVVPRTSKGGAVVEMEGGPLRSAYRGRSQTAGCC